MKMFKVSIKSKHVRWALYAVEGIAIAGILGNDGASEFISTIVLLATATMQGMIQGLENGDGTILDIDLDREDSE